MSTHPLKTGQKLGKYRLEGKLGSGGFATVYKAVDTIEGLRVALKIPFALLMSDEELDDLRQEVRLTAKLNHPNILPLKNADFIEGRFVLTYPLGKRTLADRLQSRLSVASALEFADQMLAAAAYAHDQRVIHCDIKPENMILFADGQLKLADFGFAKIAHRTIRASGSGTVGYCAPEQAMGQPSFRSDVFSLGLIMIRMLGGRLPEWPFDWPPPGYARLRQRVHPDLIDLLRKSISLDPRKRFASAIAMQTAFTKVKRRALTFGSRHIAEKPASETPRHWKSVRFRQFQRQFGKQLGTRHECSQCCGPVSESMTTCPWCGVGRARHDGPTTFPLQCPRCERGLKKDWPNCPWCYGVGFDVATSREYSDKNYTARCANSACSRRLLMPFMRYCPWCRRKVKRKWKIEGTSDKCSSCGWGVVADFWSFCPWCGKPINKK